MAPGKSIDRRKSNTPDRIFIGAMILLLASAGVGLGQIRVRSDLVVVPVGVRDSDGETVTGLTKEDFTVLEDRRIQTISNFDSDPQRLSAAILVDDGIAGIELHRVASQLSAISAGITSEDEVITFRYDRSVEKLSDFSNDPKVLQKSFDAIKKVADGHTEEQHELITGGPGWLRSILGIFPDGSKGSSQNHVLHNAIYDAAMALKDRPSDRRRIVFIVSDGVASGPANVHTLAQNTELLLKSDIQVFAVSTDYARFGSYGTLTSYAAATGGDVYAGATDQSLEHAFNRVTEQARHQYVLGYSSTNTKADSGIFRAIEVRIERPNLKLTYRKGYRRYTAQ